VCTCLSACVRNRWQQIQVFLGVRTHAIASLSAKGLQEWSPLRRNLAQAPKVVVLISKPRPREPATVAAKGLTAVASQRANAVERTRLDSDFPPCVSEMNAQACEGCHFLMSTLFPFTFALLYSSAFLLYLGVQFAKLSILISLTYFFLILHFVLHCPLSTDTRRAFRSLLPCHLPLRFCRA